MMKNLFYETKTEPIKFFLSDDLTNLPHLHKELELVYVYEGEFVAYADNNAYRLIKGDLFVSFPNQIHFYENIRTGQVGICIFSPSVIFEQSSLLLKKYPRTNKIENINDNIKSATESMCTENKQYKNTVLCGAINYIMGNLLPDFDLTERKANNNYSIIKDFIEYCTQNYKENISLEIVAENLHISKYYLSHLISENLKIRFNDYINNLRINEACIELESTDNKIADISENVGYGTIRSFNRAFMKVMNISPSDYRDRVVTHK